MVKETEKFTWIYIIFKVLYYTNNCTEIMPLHLFFNPVLCPLFSLFLYLKFLLFWWPLGVLYSLIE